MSWVDSSSQIGEVDSPKSISCRLGCGACCIAPSITSPIPGMPQGKAAGERCVQLNDDNLCMLFGQPQRPALCDAFKACASVCGENSEAAIVNLTLLEQATAS